VVRLDRLGFATSTGSACSSGREKPSYVLLAMGYPPEQAGRMIRFSSGWTTDQADWQALLEGILETAGSMNP
jgi:cysteine desulfurase